MKAFLLEIETWKLFFQSRIRVSLQSTNQCIAQFSPEFVPCVDKLLQKWSVCSHGPLAAVLKRMTSSFRSMFAVRKQGPTQVVVSRRDPRCVPWLWGRGETSLVWELVCLRSRILQLQQSRGKNVCQKFITNKTGTSKVGAISKAQKAQSF